MTLFFPKNINILNIFYFSLYSLNSPLVQITSRSSMNPGFLNYPVYQEMFISLYMNFFSFVCDSVSLWDLNLPVSPSSRVNPYLVCVPAKAKLQIPASSYPFSHIKNIFYVNKYLFTTAFSKVHSILLMNITYLNTLYCWTFMEFYHVYVCVLLL